MIVRYLHQRFSIFREARSNAWDPLCTVYFPLRSAIFGQHHLNLVSSLTFRERGRNNDGIKALLTFAPELKFAMFRTPSTSMAH
jgi:hypothetical protein